MSTLADPRAQRLHQAFQLSMLLKGLDGILEIAGGVLVYLIKPGMISGAIAFLTQHELVEDPHDFVATHLVSFLQHFSLSTQYFAALYLLLHGVIKVFLVAALWRGKLWSYPLAMAFLVAFIVYQVYRVSYSYSLGLVLLTVFDAAVLWLVWHEYSQVKRRGMFRPAAA